MKFFHVIYVEVGLRADLLDALRLVCNPDTRQAAHLTVRGPFVQPGVATGLRTRVLGVPVVVGGLATFFESNRNTVFLEARADGLRDVWHKPDFPFRPHVTIYDGEDVDFAARLFRLLAPIPMCFAFVARELCVLATGGNDLPFSDALLARIVGPGTSRETLRALSTERRLILAEELARRLASMGMNGVRCLYADRLSGGNWEVGTVVETGGARAFDASRRASIELWAPSLASDRFETCRSLLEAAVRSDAFDPVLSGAIVADPFATCVLRCSAAEPPSARPSSERLRIFDEVRHLVSDLVTIWFESSRQPDVASHRSAPVRLVASLPPVVRSRPRRLPARAAPSVRCASGVSDGLPFGSLGPVEPE